MKRKSFLKGALGMAAGTLLAGSRGAAQEAPRNDCEKKMAGKNKFILAWITAWLANMKKQLPEAEGIKLIEANGRACAANHGMIDWAASFSGDVDKFIAAMRPHLGGGDLRRDGGKVTMIYEKCLCPLVGDVEGTLPGEYCLCTRGWTKAVFGALAGREVKVDLKSSIKRGDPRCLVEIDLA